MSPKYAINHYQNLILQELEEAGEYSLGALPAAIKCTQEELIEDLMPLINFGLVKITTLRNDNYQSVVITKLGREFIYK